MLPPATRSCLLTDVRRVALAACGGLALSAAALTSDLAHAADWHVAADGSPAGDGSASAPWDLGSVASGAKPVAPGDVVWVHAGGYGDGGNQPLDFSFHGSPAAPIVVRAVKGARATIDGGVTVSGTWITLWGLEITNSSTNRDTTTGAGEPGARLGGVNLYGRGARAINLVVHDTGHPAIGFWAGPGDGAEVSGCILWGNGVYDPSVGGAIRGNGTYAQNETGERFVRDNVSFRNWTEGLDAHSAGSGWVNGFTFEGNIVFDNPVGQITANTKDPTKPMKGLTIRDNCTYRRDADAAKTTVQAGYYGDVHNEDLTVEGNTLVMGSDDERAFHVKLWKNATVRDNTIVSQRYMAWWWNGVPGEVVDWDQNRYFGGNAAPFVLGAGSDVANGIDFNTFDQWKLKTGNDGTSSFTPSKPTGVHVCKRPNRHEADRAFLAVYNWDGLASVDVDLTDLLVAGAEWELVDLQNYYGPAVARGTFAGATVTVPMNLTEVAPIVGRYTHWTNAHTAPEFAAFELRSTQPLRDGGASGSGGTGAGGGSGAGAGGTSGSGVVDGGLGGQGGGATGGAAPVDGGVSGRGGVFAGGAAGARNASGDDSGCGCRAAPVRGGGRGAMVLAGALLAAALRRRTPRRFHRLVRRGAGQPSFLVSSASHRAVSRSESFRAVSSSADSRATSPPPPE